MKTISFQVVVLRTKDFIGINMPNTQQLRMEDMSVAYVRALCAVNGYSIGSVEHDNDGYDITINCSGCPTDNCKKHSPSIQVQLKSSYAKIHSNNDGTISFGSCSCG